MSIQYRQSVLYDDGTPVPTILTPVEVARFLRIRTKHNVRSVHRLCREHGLKYFVVCGLHRRFLLDDVLEFARTVQRSTE